jgi:hypothetical protein
VNPQRLRLPLALACALAAGGCRARPADPWGPVIDASYDAYEEMAQAVVDSSDCAEATVAVDRVRVVRIVELTAAADLQRDPERMRAADAAFAARRDRYRQVSDELDAALSECTGEPAFDAAVERFMATSGH